MLGFTKIEGDPTLGAHVCSVGEKWASLRASWVFGSKLGHDLGYGSMARASVWCEISHRLGARDLLDSIH